MLTALVAVVALAVVAGLAVALARARSRADDLARLLREATAERHRVEAEAATSRDHAAAARRERDDAFERVQRARRDAAEVAERLEAERAARASAEEDGAARETELAEVRGELDALRDELRVATEALNARGGAEANDGAGAAAWALTCTRVEHVWRTSVALHPGEPSPLVGDDPLRAAIEVLVTAVREEAGADVEVSFAGGAEVGPAPAVALLALVEAILLATAKAEAATSLLVTFEPAGVEVVVTLDGRAETPAGVPEDLVVGPGRFLVATGAPAPG